MNEDRNPLESALDVFVYGPLGLFITVTEEMPRLVEKGRERLTSQLTTARMLGQMAAPQLQAEAEKLMRGVMDRMSSPPGGPARPPARRAASPGVPAGGGAPSSAAPSGPAPSGPAPTPAPRPVPAPPPAPQRPAPHTGNGSVARSGDSAHLAIPGYDTLSAMQVVQRLAGLSPTELEAVRSYEAANRGRKTILHRAEQLLSDPAD
ncbi:MAG TPA: hypothetical protein VFH58_04560 [Acidimicrobiales bacterium]|nr:hypothetical protein [Acidimicrobiales bacterium]